jgi:ribosomal protein L7/L12
MPMLIVDITGWRPGFKTVSFIKLIRQHGTESLDLAEAKSLVDRLLEGKRFSLNFVSENEAASFIHKAERLGAVVEPHDSASA